MRTPGIVQRHPELRWLVATVLVAAVGAAAVSFVSGVFRKDSALPATNPEQLVAQVQAPHDIGYSGTIVAHVNLGMPTSVLAALASALPVGGSLLGGAHTMRYWYGGIDQQRVAVVGQAAEQDVFRNGSTLLLWDTRTRIAQRTTVPKDAVALPLSLASPAALTPPELAGRMLGLAGDSTDTTLRSGDQVADRSTYELVVRPESASSRIDSVHIEIDGTHSVPLSVRIYARGSVSPAVDVSFTSINFAQPSAQNFSFTPPPGSDTRTGSPLGGDVSVVGSGWLSVATYRSAGQRAELLARAVSDDLQEVKGGWGKGRLLQSPLLCVLVTDTGRIAPGPVDPAVLYRALAQ